MSGFWGLLPPSPRDWLSENHLVYFLLDVVGEMDLAPFFERYKNFITGQPPFHPRMMVTLLLYGYCKGVFSSRKIQSRCADDVAFRVIVGEDIPDFRTISNFRKGNRKHMQSLFVQTLQVCAEAGLMRLGRVALDGAKVKANASRHKAMSSDRMKTDEERLQQEIAKLMLRRRLRIPLMTNSSATATAMDFRPNWLGENRVWRRFARLVKQLK